MKRLVASELTKLRTTRMVYLMLIGVVALAGISVIDPERSAAAYDKPFHEHLFVLLTAMLTRVMILVVGIRAITDEFRHGTIVPSLLVSPRRGRVLVAKVIAAAGVGAFFGLVAWGVMTGAASALAASEGASLQLGSGAMRSLGGTVAAGAAWAALGVGIGAIIRSQVAAIVSGLLWLMLLEENVRSWLGDLDRFLPGQAGFSLALAPTPRALWVGALTMAAYVAAGMWGGAWSLKRDVT